MLKIHLKVVSQICQRFVSIVNFILSFMLDLQYFSMYHCHWGSPIDLCRYLEWTCLVCRKGVELDMLRYQVPIPYAWHEFKGFWWISSSGGYQVPFPLELYYYYYYHHHVSFFYHVVVIIVVVIIIIIVVILSNFILIVILIKIIIFLLLLLLLLVLLFYY